MKEKTGQPSGVGEPRTTMRSVVVRNIKTGELRQDTKLADEPLSEGWEEIGEPREVGEGLREALERIAEISHHNLSDKQKCIHCIAKKALQDARYALAAPKPAVER